MTGALDPTHRYRLNCLDLVAPDGQPVRWALNLLYRASLKDRVYGPTLMLMVCAAAAGRGIPIFLYGGQESQLRALQRRLREQIPSLIIAGAEASKFRKITPEEKKELISTVRSSGAQLVFVGLGCPRQEVWVFEFRDTLRMPLIAVGAAFAFHAGLVKQAPQALQAVGLEWAFRLLQEPRRLWRRYLRLNPLFMWHLMLQATRLRKYDPTNVLAPIGDMSYG